MFLTSLHVLRGISVDIAEDADICQEYHRPVLIHLKHYCLQPKGALKGIAAISLIVKSGNRQFPREQDSEKYHGVF